MWKKDETAASFSTRQKATSFFDPVDEPVPLIPVPAPTRGKPSGLLSRRPNSVSIPLVRGGKGGASGLNPLRQRPAEVRKAVGLACTNGSSVTLADAPVEPFAKERLLVDNPVSEKKPAISSGDHRPVDYELDDFEFDDDHALSSVNDAPVLSVEEDFLRSAFATSQESLKTSSSVSAVNVVVGEPSGEIEDDALPADLSSVYFMRAAVEMKVEEEVVERNSLEDEKPSNSSLSEKELAEEVAIPTSLKRSADADVAASGGKAPLLKRTKRKIVVAGDALEDENVVPKKKAKAAAQLSVKPKKLSSKPKAKAAKAPPSEPGEELVALDRGELPEPLDIDADLDEDGFLKNSGERETAKGKAKTKAVKQKLSGLARSRIVRLVGGRQMKTEAQEIKAKAKAEKAKATGKSKSGFDNNGVRSDKTGDKMRRQVTTRAAGANKRKLTWNSRKKTHNFSGGGNTLFGEQKMGFSRSDQNSLLNKRAQLAREGFATTHFVKTPGWKVFPRYGSIECIELVVLNQNEIVFVFARVFFRKSPLRTSADKLD